MKVSGFTFIRNAIELGYPIEESIASVLPICDEFVIAAGDSHDGTTELLERIDSPKIKLIHTRWDPALFVRGAIFAQQTNVALQACSGDWAFYIQADEVVHERDLAIIEVRLRDYLSDRRIEGLLFDYLHFFGDYGQVQTSHNWYAREIRVVRTGIGVESWHDAQGFRRNGAKLRVAHSGASMYHYGWVRPPRRLHRKSRAFNAAYVGEQAAAAPADDEGTYPWGLLHGLRRYTGSHPEVMQARVQTQDWTLQPTAKAWHKHDHLRIRILSWIENNLLGFRVAESQNYILLSDLPRELSPIAWKQRLARYRE